MKKNWRKLFFCVFGLVAFYATGSMVYRALPLMRKQENCGQILEKKAFQRQLAKPLPEWAQRQIRADFESFSEQTITAEAVDFLYREIRSKIGQQILHYRILNNKLYKYIPEGREFSSRDTLFERAFKTLLSYTKVPDLDFLLCPMDGIPEPYVPQDFFLSSDPQKQVPLLGQAKRKEPASQYIVLIPDQFSLTESWANDLRDLKNHLPIPWENKKEAAMWRGSLTDVGVPGDYVETLAACPRFKISQLSVLYPDRINAGISTADSEKTISVLSREQLIRGPANKRDHLVYKYLPVLDGHMCTYPGYQWRLFSNSVAFKQESDQIQWFYGALQPYEHYVPVCNDMGNLLEQIAWAKENDAKVQAIAEKAQQFAKNNLLLEHNYVYLFKVLQHYASFQAIDFKKLKTQTRQDPKWECIQYRKRTQLMRTLRKIMQFGKRIADAPFSPELPYQRA